MDQQGAGGAFAPSCYQQAVFDWITGGQGSAIIEAVAGSGKTTTIVQALELIPTDRRVLFLAFNKSIAEELGRRVPGHVAAGTFHATCFRALKEVIGRRVRVEAYKVRDLLRANLCEKNCEVYGQGVAKLVGLAKGVGVGILVPDAPEAWRDILAHHEIEFGEGADDERAIEIARACLRESNELAEQVIDYDDMLYLALLRNAPLPQHDWVFVDEAQDVNQVQRAILRRLLRHDGRLVAVGDPAQAIYGFRGADSQALENVGKEFDAIRLPLSISYRCPRAVVAAAREFVPTIQPHESAPEGVVANLESFDAATLTPADAILCRCTAPLVKAAYSLMHKGIGCRVLGREIGAGITSLIKRMKAKNVNHLCERLQEYASREVGRLQAQGREPQAQAVQDKVECALAIIDRVMVQENPTIAAVLREVEQLFTDNGKGLLTLATVHKSKGLEWGRVFVLDRFKLMPSKWARQAWQKEQEVNLIYVAYTRAKRELYFVTGELLAGK